MRESRRFESKLSGETAVFLGITTGCCSAKTAEDLLARLDDFLRMLGLAGGSE